MKNHKGLRVLFSLIIICAIAIGGYYVYAKTDLLIASYEVEFVCTDGDTDATKIKVKSNKKIENLPDATKEGYDFVGWFDGEVQFTTESEVKSNLKLIARFKPKKIDITFIVDGVSYTEKEDYDSLPVFDGDLVKTPTETIAYEFVGWEPALEIVKASKTYTAKFEAVTRKYKIEGKANYPKACTILGVGKDFGYKDSTTISLSDIKAGYDFLGWYKSDGETLVTTELSFTISSIEDDETFIAKFKQNFYSARFIVDNNEIDSLWQKLEYEENLIKPIVDMEKLHMDGYSIDGWYTDSACTNKFVFGNKLTENITLYGKYKYNYSNGFYDKKEKYDALRGADTLAIDSLDELICYVEYLLFYEKNANNLVKLTYNSFGNQNALREEIEKAASMSALPTYGLYYSIYSNLNFRLYVQGSYSSVEAKYVADSSKSHTLHQQDSPFLLNSSATRSDDYVFPVEYIEKSLYVSTSNQLVYCLEKGLKPIPITNSSAEKMYKKAKIILREICNDDMTNIEKGRAIYEWLIMNVQYDNYAADPRNNIISENWYKYDSWFLEGVFDSKVAVCDGIAKAYLVMAQIENIPTIRVDGNAHAWNKSYFEGNWYGVDATHGNVIVNSSYEVISYASFMFTDSYKESLSYSTIDYPEIKATTIYNIYDNLKFKFNKDNFDLFANNNDELKLIFKYIDNVDFDSEYLTVEIAFDSSATVSLIDAMIRYASLSLNNLEIRLTGNVFADSAGNNIKTLYFQKVA